MNRVKSKINHVFGCCIPVALMWFSYCGNNWWSVLNLRELMSLFLKYSWFACCDITMITGTARLHTVRKRCIWGCFQMACLVSNNNNISIILLSYLYKTEIRLVEIERGSMCSWTRCFSRWGQQISDEKRLESTDWFAAFNCSNIPMFRLDYIGLIA